MGETEITFCQIGILAMFPGDEYAAFRHGIDREIDIGELRRRR